jgi:hypothetical protein
MLPELPRDKEEQCVTHACFRQALVRQLKKTCPNSQYSLLRYAVNLRKSIGECRLLNLSLWIALGFNNLVDVLNVRFVRRYLWAGTLGLFMKSLATDPSLVLIWATYGTPALDKEPLRLLNDYSTRTLSLLRIQSVDQ